MLVEVSERGLRTRENVVVRDPDDEIRAWGSVHDRAAGGCCSCTSSSGTHCPTTSAGRCSDACSSGRSPRPARSVPPADLEVQQINTGAFADDEQQAAWLAASGF